MFVIFKWFLAFVFEKLFFFNFRISRSIELRSKFTLWSFSKNSKGYKYDFYWKKSDLLDRIILIKFISFVLKRHLDPKFLNFSNFFFDIWPELFISHWLG